MRKSLASVALCVSLVSVGVGAACGGDDEYIPPVIDAAIDATPPIDAPAIDAAAIDAIELDAIELDAAPSIDATEPVDAAPDA